MLSKVLVHPARQWSSTFLLIIINHIYIALLVMTSEALIRYARISIPLLPHSFIPDLKPSFSANSSHRSLPFLLRD